MKIILKNGDILEGTNEELAMFVPKTNKINPEVQTYAIKGLRKANEITVINGKRKYHKKGSKKQWTGEEINIVAENLNLTCRKLAKMIPGRTAGAIGNIKWALKSNRLDGKRFKNYEKWLLNR